MRFLVVTVRSDGIDLLGVRVAAKLVELPVTELQVVQLWGPCLNIAFLLDCALSDDLDTFERVHPLEILNQVFS